MKRRILIIDGHPDSRAERFLHVLSAAYAASAKQAGHDVRVIDVAKLKFPLLQTADDFAKETAPPAIQRAQEDLVWCDHLVIFYPLWLGSMPALLKGFFEQVMRPGVAFKSVSEKSLPKKLLAGKSARIVVTMGMPAFFYQWYFRAHSLKSLERNILGFVGIHPIRASVIGSVETLGASKRAAWLTRLQRYAKTAH